MFLSTIYIDIIKHYKVHLQINDKQMKDNLKHNNNYSLGKESRGRGRVSLIFLSNFERTLRKF